MSKQESIINVLENIKNRETALFSNYSPAILRLHRIHDYLHLDLDALLLEYKLQDADFGVLETLRRDSCSSCLSPTELSHAMLFSSGGLTKVLNRIEEAGLIIRIDNPADKRSKLVKLTEKGILLIDNVIEQLHASEKSKLAVLSKSEQQQLDALLEKFLKIWE